MTEDDNDAAIVRTTIDLARNLGLDVVAEGVESETILRNLSDLSCDIAQGFYLSRPLPAAELDGWLRGWVGFSMPSA
jgi:EAL domain-containing protein (putative c-di-GMP-specific phosphodiesterase class I)